MSYCKNCANLPSDNVHRVYHDTAYGFPIEDDFELFGRLILEINQAGLSWDTILKKQSTFYEAYDAYDYHKIAAYEQQKIDELLSNPGIIRNRLKVNAAIHNAQKIIELNQQFGSFKNWIESQNAKSLDEWVKIFKKNFKFVGKEIVNEFLMSISVLEGAHESYCEIHHQIIKLRL